ncbi:hypothetical protein GCM10027085_43220 [Spirosoma aerophilum]
MNPESYAVGLSSLYKLLRQAFAVVKFDEDFDPNYKPIFTLDRLTFNTVHKNAYATCLRIIQIPSRVPNELTLQSD